MIHNRDGTCLASFRGPFQTGDSVCALTLPGRATPNVGADADADAKPVQQLEAQTTSVIENSTAISEDKIPATSNL